jgi:hypothetical protein
MVREEIINKVFGFQAKSFSNLAFFQKDSRARSKWIARMSQHMVESVVSYGVDRIVVATTSVIANNLISNNFQLMMRKISPVYIAVKTLEGFTEYRAYQKDADRLRLLNKEIKAKSLPRNSSEFKEALATRKRMEQNKIHRMSAAGVNSIIVEDLNDAKTKGYFDRAQKLLQSDKVTRYTDNIAVNTLGAIAKTAFMTKTSAPYRISRKVVALSDFLARYVMIEHAMEKKGQDFDSAMFEAIDAFVLFDENLSPWLDSLSSVAGVLFASYFLRNQRAARKLIKAEPTAVATSAGIQYATDIPTLANIDSSIYMGELLPSNLQPISILEIATDASGLQAVGIDLIQ